MLIRDAVPGDLPAILEIHNEAVLNTTANWYEEPSTLEDRQEWLDWRADNGYPVLTADEDGVVVGFASYGPWRPKNAYRHTVENSVYVHVDHHRKGVAKALMTELVARAKADGRHVVVAYIESSNENSIALHRKVGFEVAGLLPGVGKKFGRFLDLTIMQLTLSP
ncbi:GNAT family N-acetyltransferase [Tomitella biformata]|uniref:GNAT family N-acetyltransferase n=1 Tax=Tomitella biformata TaxID=630403 RepID=UPI000570D16A|nr:GNAT family N-acetyltransferase [Tomitella biformata]